MRKNRKMGENIHYLKRRCHLNKKEAEMLYYIICCRITRERKTAKEILDDFKQGKIKLKKESPYYKRLMKLNVMG